jgi:hypothetical protein
MVAGQDRGLSFHDRLAIGVYPVSDMRHPGPRHEWKPGAPVMANCSYGDGAGDETRPLLL